MLHILYLKDDSRNHVKCVIWCKVRQSFHRLSNLTFLPDVLKYDIHAHPSDLVTHVCHARFSKEDQALVICVPRKSTHTTTE
jgi:hypothetical protein